MNVTLNGYKMNNSTLLNRINAFDYFYHYSDDTRTYSRWSREEESINSELGKLSSNELYEIATQAERKDQALKQFRKLSEAKKPEKESFRTKVFKRAYEIRKSTGKAFSVCLSKSWAIYRLSKKMLSGEAKFTYEKVDGTLRKAIGTLKDVGQFIKGSGKSNSKVFHYWDMEAVGFRCFKVENLVTVF